MEQVYRVDGRVQCGQPHAFAVTVPEVSETDQYDADTLGYVDPLDSFGITHRAFLFVLLIGIYETYGNSSTACQHCVNDRQLRINVDVCRFQ